MNSYLLLILLAAFASVNSQKKSCHIREIDLCMSPFLAGNSQSLMPTNEIQVQKTCKTMRQMGTCLMKYTRRCTSELQEKTFLWASKEQVNQYNEMCSDDNDDAKKELLKNSQCINKSFQQKNGCGNDLRNAIEVLMTINYRNRMTLICCAAKRFEDCFTKSLNLTCDSGAVDNMMKLYNSLTGGLFDVLCQAYTEDNPTCKELLPPKGWISTTKSNSVLLRMMKVAGF